MTSVQALCRQFERGDLDEQLAAIDEADSPMPTRHGGLKRVLQAAGLLAG